MDESTTTRGGRVFCQKYDKACLVDVSDDKKYVKEMNEWIDEMSAHQKEVWKKEHPHDAADYDEAVKGIQDNKGSK